MAKKKIQIDRVWVILADDALHSIETSFEKAKTESIEIRDANVSVRVLEVVAVWDVEFPEEPDAELYEASLANL